MGSVVSFPNFDPIFHNVFSLSKSKSFDLGYYPEGQTRKVRFERPGVVQVFCHLHANMSAAVVVTPNGWFARPARDGSFVLRSVPAGQHTVVLWHKSAGFFRQKVELAQGSSVHAAFEIPIAVAGP
jgi:hypothetical protein